MASDHPTRTDLTAECVRRILDYDPETGVFRWRHRPDARREWNTRYAGKVAGTAKPGRLTSYIRLNVGGRLYYAHRVAWLIVHGEWPEDQIDHVNGDGADNRIANLRPASNAENLRNRGKTRGNEAGAKGVCWDAWARRWKASITVDGEHRHLGRFDTPEEAHAAYARAAQEHHGEFHRVD